MATTPMASLSLSPNTLAGSGSFRLACPVDVHLGTDAMPCSTTTLHTARLLPPHAANQHVRGPGPPRYLSLHRLDSHRAPTTMLCACTLSALCLHSTHTLPYHCMLVLACLRTCIHHAYTCRSSKKEPQHRLPACYVL
ncbi:uncharacterized protein SETTUDRAFT_163460, partial [Exserohilum turcica Et28A]